MILNGLPQCLFAEKKQFGNTLISFTNESADEVTQVMKAYASGVDRPEFKYTHGNFYRGIE